ncbi:unnamed protein product [Mytilus coruscus]|uniref:DNA-directed DNA polymerase n=1 Tax=Mytilus coruscus TaxID=42192 RepID=A0A6J8D8A9_MYTCO|nr:unnamed protein product [Mytilus coruscus]
MAPKKSFKDIISETTINDIEEPDATKYINLLKDKIVIDQFPLKIKIIITSEFATPIAFDRIESHYSHPAKVVLTQNNLSKFYDDLIDKFKAWVDQFQERGSGFDFNSIKSVQDKPILNKYEEDEFQEATECYICGKEFEENNKVREHDHLSGKYRGAACQSCNTKEDYRILDEHEGKGCLEKLKNGGNLNNCFKKNYLLYLDANNLYGWSMSKKLPTKDFKWEEDPDYYKKVPKGRGCLIKCDLKYTDKCKKKTIKYPLAPEKTRPKKEELSNYQLNLLGNKPLGNEEKLFLTGKDKKKYIVHYKVLKDYIKLGMKVTKVYKTISFKESDWLAKYINFNTEQRTKSKSDFEKDLWKLMNNSFYGKTLEDIRGRSEIKLLTDRKK